MPATRNSTAALDHVRNRILACTACALRKEAKKPVPCEAIINQTPVVDRLFIVGRNPGVEDDTSNKPFAGANGTLLESIFAKVGFNRSDLFITNLVKCFSKDNREPTPQEVRTCTKWLEQELEIVRPRFVVTLGALAAESVTGVSFVNEQVITVDKLWSGVKRGMLVATIYHPGYVLRNEDQLESYQQSWEKVARMWKKLLENKNDPIAMKGFI